MQRLLNAVSWDADGVWNGLRAYGVEQLGVQEWTSRTPVIEPVTVINCPA
ncbi:hypothetical protein ACFFQW_26735 [Umezawaea endophytica]